MPLYEFECDACGKRFEVIRKFSDPPLDACAVCGKGPVRRLLSSPAIQFKGSGWYITDYSQKGKNSEDSSSSGTSDAKAGDAAKKDNKKSDSGTESTSSSSASTSKASTTEN